MWHHELRPSARCQLLPSSQLAARPLKSLPIARDVCGANDAVLIPF